MSYDTYVAKLTLSVDETVVVAAKRYATARGTSVSRLVETFLDAIARPGARPDRELPPVTRRLRGVLKNANLDRDHYLDYLERKYR